MKKENIVFLQIIFITTGLCILIYLAGQQLLRVGANDPQEQIVQEAIISLHAGKTPSSIVGNNQVDISQSLDPFVIIYDNKGSILASSALLDGTIPSIPSGVLDYTKAHGEDRVTWQPRNDVREATIIRYMPENGMYILSGRSLRLVEEREETLLRDIFIAWGGLLGGILILEAVKWHLFRQK